MGEFGPHALACPRDAMTGRDLCSLLLRLMGVYYAFGAAFQLIAGLSYLSMRLTGSMDTPAAIVSAQFASMLVHIVACYLLIVRADALTDHLFPKDQLINIGLTRRDFTLVALLAIGVATLVGAAPDVAIAAAKVVWYTEGGRQSLFVDAFRYTWESIIRSVLALVLSVVLLLTARTITRTFDKQTDPRRSGE